MIRLIHCVKKKESVSTDDFRHFWNGPEFNSLIDSIMKLTLTMEVKKNLTLDIPLNTELQMERYSKQPFDGVLEIILPSGKDVNALMQEERMNELYQQMTDLQMQYIDFNESRRFFTEYIETD